MSSLLKTKAGAVLAYSLCSSSMLLVNKVAMVGLKQFPASVSLTQFAFSVIFVYTAKFAGMINVDELQLSKVRPFFWYVVSFVASIYCNMKALGESNVETVIVFRSCSPIIVAVLDYLFLGRELPSYRSLASLIIIVIGSATYVATDKAFAMTGAMAYTWVSAYLVLICFNMSYGKYLISGVKMVDPIWGSVLYNNTLSLLPTWMLGAIGGENLSAFVLDVNWTNYQIMVVLLSCIIGTAISWAGFNCRKALSAASYTLVGVLNKLLTVLFNVIMFEDHASMLGLGALFICIIGGTFYQQAPLRNQGYQKVHTSDNEESSTDSSKGTQQVEMSVSKA